MTVDDDTNQRYGTDGTEPTIDELTCASRDIERQAQVMQEVRSQLDTFREQYGTARTAYGPPLSAAKDDVATAMTRLDQLQGDIDCKVSAQDRARLDGLWDDVRDDVEQCMPGRGCRVTACSPDSSVDDDESQADLTGRIQALRQDAAERAAYFEDLIAEPTDLPARVTTAVQVVEELANDLRAEPQGTGTGGPTEAEHHARNAQLYVRARVARWRLESVTRVFDTVDAYTTCLQESLTCILRMWQAVATLEGAHARKACRDAQAAAACAALMADPVTEVVTRFNDRQGHPAAPTTTAG